MLGPHGGRVSRASGGAETEARSGPLGMPPSSPLPTPVHCAHDPKQIAHTLAAPLRAAVRPPCRLGRAFFTRDPTSRTPKRWVSQRNQACADCVNLSALLDPTYELQTRRHRETGDFAALLLIV